MLNEIGMLKVKTGRLLGIFNQDNHLLCTFAQWKKHCAFVRMGLIHYFQKG